MPRRGVKKGSKRARHGESMTASQRLAIHGRSRMNKAQLERAVEAKKR